MEYVLDSMNDCLNKGLNVGQEMSMVYDRIEWHGFVTGSETLG